MTATITENPQIVETEKPSGSTLLVDVCAVLDVQPHPNADRLDIIKVKGWSVIVRKGIYNVGDKVVYFPPDTCLPPAWIEKFAIGNYCKYAQDQNGVRQQNRIGAIRLRHVSSFGHVEPAPEGFDVGTSMIDYYGATKYEPPAVRGGETAPQIPGFYKYKGPEQWQNFPDAIADGTEVVITEKIHGRNCRAALLRTDDGFQFFGGSHNFPYKEHDNKERRCIYWGGLTDKTKAMLQYLSAGEKNVILFGEIYGQGLQDMTYGEKGHAFRAFDISIDGDYMSWYDFIEVCQKFGVETCPILYVGPYSQAKVLELTDGPTEVCPESAITTKFKGREGVVVKPTTETRQDFRGGLTRVLLKSVSADYHARKGGTDEH
jgi:RNA ligase (TIGR02306 family)